MGGVYHITMLVSGEQEDAIRLLFRDKNWPCWIKILTDECVASLIQSGHTDVFPTIGEEYGMASSVYTEIKSEIVDVDAHDDEDDVNDTVVAVPDKQFPDASKSTTETHVIDEDDNTMDYDMIQDKAKCNIDDIKTEAVEEDEEEPVGTQTRQSKKSPKKAGKKIKCSLCDTYCVTRTLLKRHCRRRHKGMWLEFECKECGEKFKTKDELWEHRRDVDHGPRKVFNTISKTLHTPEELIAMGHLKCDICSNFYPHKRSLRRHMIKVHRDILPKWSCAVCGAEYDSRDALWRHKRQNQHKTSLWALGNYQCDSCGKIYNRYDSFKEHKLSCKTEGKESEESKDFPCDICGIVFKSMLRVKSHKRGVHVVNPVVCHVCGAMCKNKRALLVHRRRHDMKNKKFGCDDCGKTFFNNTLLTQHIRTHTKEKPYKCPLCNYRCAIKQNIHKHSQKVHKTPSKAIELNAASSDELSLQKSIEAATNLVDLSIDLRNTSAQRMSPVQEMTNVSSYNPINMSDSRSSLPEVQNYSMVKELGPERYNPTSLSDTRQLMPELQKYSPGRRELHGVDKMLNKTDQEILPAPPAQDSMKDRYPTPYYDNSHMNDLQDLRLPSAIRSSDSFTGDIRKNYMASNLGNYPGVSDLSYSQRASETNPYKYNWGVNPPK